MQPLYAGCGFSMVGADVQTAFFAQKSGRKMYGLETPEDRQRILGKISDEEKGKSAAYQALSALQQSATGSDDVGRRADNEAECRDIEKAWQVWKTEDIPAMEQQVAQASADPFMRYLIDERNKLFFERIKQHLGEKGRMFVALGSMHLYGKNGLLALFAADGHTIRWVP